MNTERLNHLITVLEGVSAARKAFNLSAWAMNKKMGVEVEDHSNTVGDVKETCGTACCAMGYAALDPGFVDQGLRLSIRVSKKNQFEWENVYPDSLEAFNKLMRKRNVDFGEADIVFNSLTSSHAAADFFEIEYEAANQLFMPYKYSLGASPITPEMVIERVRQVIANNGKTLELAE